MKIENLTPRPKGKKRLFPVPAMTEAEKAESMHQWKIEQQRSIVSYFRMSLYESGQRGYSAGHQDELRRRMAGAQQELDTLLGDASCKEDNHASTRYQSN